ncbi:unnamed protein product [Protopolystoma xenopodis]|uniref:Nudix hydrolase domain-containing protein n=1 Tax=Protopolystoma xenopodis TaxID=117903 RepID=A0A3S5ATR8_9PLAT|nr:unnamed protein product [Protopolystoma xenopodis]
MSLILFEHYGFTPPATFKSNVDRWVLLGRKQRGIGKGNLNGFGGKVELHDLSPLLAAVRELEEESGLRVAPELFDEAARLYFTFERQEELPLQFLAIDRCLSLWYS